METLQNWDGCTEHQCKELWNPSDLKQIPTITPNFLQRLPFTDPLTPTAKISSVFSSCGAECQAMTDTQHLWSRAGWTSPPSPPLLSFCQRFLPQCLLPHPQLPPSSGCPLAPHGGLVRWEKLEPSGEMKAAELSGHTQRTENCNKLQILSWEAPCTTASIDGQAWCFHGSSIRQREKALSVLLNHY